MLLNERWIWLGDPVSLEESGIVVFRLYPGSWMLAYGTVALGPLDDASVLRAARMACTPCIDGCELGPTQLGVRVLSVPRRPLRREPRWQEVAERDLPEGRTIYDRAALEPVSGCCTTFDAMPKLGPVTEDSAERERELLAPWNAHPAGSRIVFERDLHDGFAVIDLP